jgi:hypothetical protein
VELAPATDAEIATLGLERLVAATTAALGAPEKLAPNTHAAQLAVAVAWHLGEQAGFPQQGVAAALGRSRSTLWRRGDKGPPTKSLRTVRLRLALDSIVTTTPLVLPAPPPEVLGVDSAPTPRTHRRTYGRA